MLKYFEKVKRPLIQSGSNEVGCETSDGEMSHKKARDNIEVTDEDIIVDPALRKPIEEFDSRIRDEVRRRYILIGRCQPLTPNFPMTKFGEKNRQFQKSWFSTYPWLEYSVSKDAAFCFMCYLFKGKKQHPVFGDEAFTKKGFRNWKKASERFKDHVGGLQSVHNDCQTQYFAYKDQRQSIVHSCSSAQARMDVAYRTRLTASVDVVRLLLRNGLAFRGNDESEKSLYKGNFLEILQWYSERSPEVKKVCLKNAPKNNQLTSSDIQKDIVSACAEQTKKVILDDIGDRFFAILVDGARDSSIKEQISFVLRYVNKFGEVLERFIGITHVSDTSAQSLKFAVENMLTKHGLSISRVRGQGYDGASNMRGELNGLKALILAENPTAWYVHCFAHQLQLVVVSVAKEIQVVCQFFDYVSMIVNMVGASCKRKDALRQKQHDKIVQSLQRNEISTGTGLHQETSLARPGETRWGSYYKTIVRLLSTWTPILEVLGDIYNDGICKKQRGTVLGLVDKMESYEFVFIAHLMREILGLTSELSYFLQQKKLNIVSAVGLIDTTKIRLQQLRDDGWKDLLKEVNSFCSKYDIRIINMEDRIPSRLRSQSAPTYYHYFHVDIFCQVLDRIIGEMNSRFTESSSELLMCISCLDPRNSFEKFDHSKLLHLAELYQDDFSTSDHMQLQEQLKVYITEMRRNNNFTNLDGIGALATKMVELDFHHAFQLVYKLIELALVLPVATASVERTFSAMKIIKTDLRNKIDDDFLNDCMMCNVEKEIFSQIDNEVILDHFQNMKTRRKLLPPKN